jgi:hypothetical protein
MVPDTYQRGERNKGSQKTPFLAINAKGEKVLAQSKRTAPPIFKIFKNNDLRLSFQLISYNENFSKLTCFPFG